MAIRTVTLKKAFFAVLASAVLTAVSGCVVAPYPPGGAAYVDPYYPSPGVNWVWEFNPSIGWGWHHPQHGWYRGGGHGGHGGRGWR